jgi:hypothetical protein
VAEESKVTRAAGSESRLGFGAAAGGVGVLGEGVGWWEGVFAKVERGRLQNDTNIKFLLLCVKINFVLRGFMQNIRT